MSDLVRDNYVVVKVHGTAIYGPKPADVPQSTWDNMHPHVKEALSPGGYTGKRS